MPYQLLLLTVWSNCVFGVNTRAGCRVCGGAPAPRESMLQCQTTRVRTVLACLRPVTAPTRQIEVSFIDMPAARRGTTLRSAEGGVFRTSVSVGKSRMEAYTRTGNSRVWAR